MCCDVDKHRVGLRCALQIRAIIEAAVNVSKDGVKVHPHIMVPLVGIEEELTGQAKIINEVAQQVGEGDGWKHQQPQLTW